MKAITATLLLSVALAGPAHAETTKTAPVSPKAPVSGDPTSGNKSDLRIEPGPNAQERRAQRLDTMFDRLADAPTKRRADRIARHIMRRLSRSGSDTVDVLMTQAGIAMRTKRYAIALDLLDGVVRMEPEFAEGWNRRATVHYIRGDYGASIADIEQVLRYEPRHWGALAGLSMILVSMDRKADAVTIMDKALAVHPYLEEMKARRDKLAKELEGAPT